MGVDSAAPTELIELTERGIDAYPLVVGAALADRHPRYLWPYRRDRGFAGLIEDWLTLPAIARVSLKFFERVGQCGKHNLQILTNALWTSRQVNNECTAARAGNHT